MVENSTRKGISSRRIDQAQHWPKSSRRVRLEPILDNYSARRTFSWPWRTIENFRRIPRYGSWFWPTNLAKHQSFIISHQWSIFNQQWSIIFHESSVIIHQSSIISQSYIINQTWIGHHLDVNWDDLGVIMGSSGRHLGIIWASFGDHLGPFGDHLGTI